MAIKEVTCIPADVKEVCQKNLILNDIIEAMKKGIVNFEFVGNEYNYKYLDQYARRVSCGIVRKKLNTKIKELEKELLNKNETTEKGFRVHHDTYPLEKSFITFTTKKPTEETQHKRVFCHIDFSDFDEKVRELVVNDIERTRRNYSFVNGKWERVKK